MCSTHFGFSRSYNSSHRVILWPARLTSQVVDRPWRMHSGHGMRVRPWPQMLMYAERAAVRAGAVAGDRQRVALERPLHAVPKATVARFVLLGSEKLTRKIGHQAYSDRTLTLFATATRRTKLSSMPAIACSFV